MITFSHLGNYGRMANQMFQYAALLNVSVYNEYTFGIPFINEIPKFWVHDPHGSFKYGLELHKCFNLTAKDSSNVKSIYHYSQIDFHYNPDILHIKDNSDIVGYFQSELYFKESKDRVIKEFEFKNDIALNAMNLYYGLKSSNTNTFVSLHIRRGDYLMLPDHHPLCSYEYYKNAIDYIKAKIGDDFTCIVFSDDIEGAKYFLKDLKNLIFVNYDTYTDLCLMSMCDHHIIANSSYSWWGAYLCKNKNKIVISPSKWFGKLHNNLNTRDIIPFGWVKL